MSWSRIRRMAFISLCGGLLLQTTTGGCQDVLAPLIANLVSSVVTNALLGGTVT